MDRAPVTQKMRISIAAAQEYKCKMCDKLFEEPWQIDHVTPLREGGVDDETNMQALCTPCHRDKSSEEMRMRSSKALKAATKRLLSKTLYDYVFDYPIETDVIIDAEEAFLSLRKMESSMDASQLDRFLTLYGLGRQHAPLAVIQTIFAESYGIEVRRAASSVTDEGYDKLSFTCKHIRQAELDFASVRAFSLDTRVECGGSYELDDQSDVDEECCNNHVRPVAKVCMVSVRSEPSRHGPLTALTALMKLIVVTGLPNDVISTRHLADAIAATGSYMSRPKTRKHMEALGCRYSDYVIVNGTRSRGFIGARFTKL